MRWAGHVENRGGREVPTGFCWGDLRGGDYLHDLGRDGRIILKWIFNKWNGNVWTGLPCLRIGTAVRCL